MTLKTKGCDWNLKRRLWAVKRRILKHKTGRQWPNISENLQRSLTSFQRAAGWFSDLWPLSRAVSDTTSFLVLLFGRCGSPGVQTFYICLILCSTRWKNANLLISKSVGKLEAAEAVLFCSATTTAPEHIVFSRPLNFTAVLIFNAHPSICSQRSLVSCRSIFCPHRTKFKGHFD